MSLFFLCSSHILQFALLVGEDGVVAARVPRALTVFPFFRICDLFCFGREDVAGEALGAEFACQGGPSAGVESLLSDWCCAGDVRYCSKGRIGMRCCAKNEVDCLVWLESGLELGDCSSKVGVGA